MATQSISTRFRNSLVRVVAVAMLLFTLFAAAYNITVFDQRLQARMDYAMSLAVSSLPYPMWNIDERAMEQLMESLMLDDNVAYVRLTVGDWLEHVKARSNDETRKPEDFKASSLFSVGQATITYEDQQLGTVTIVLTKHHLLYDLLVDVGLLVFLSMVIIGAISFQSIAVMRRYIFVPIKDLEDRAASIARGDLETPIDIVRDDEIGSLAASFSSMRDSIRRLVADLRTANEQLEDHNRNLEHLVAERTEELHQKNVALNKSLHEVETANRRIMESLYYAKMIQNSLLPPVTRLQEHLPDNFCIWQPRDIVGGDLFFMQPSGDGIVVAVIDCTGHGVPGALMTMIAAASLRRITSEEEVCDDPASILERLNYLVKTSLQQDTDDAESDDGLDAAVCIVKPKRNLLRFSGARLPLIYVKDGEIHRIRGDKISIGYRRSPVDYRFTTHDVLVDDLMLIYMTTDGLIDQTGGDKGFAFGYKRLRDLLEKASREPLERQRDILWAEFNSYRGRKDQLDDVTMLGFAVAPHGSSLLKGESPSFQEPPSQPLMNDSSIAFYPAETKTF